MKETAPEPANLPDRKARLAEIASLRGEAALRAFVRYVMELEEPVKREEEEDATLQTAVG